MGDVAKVGIVGCGMISEIYLKNLTGLFKEVEVLGVFDIDQEAAQRRTQEFALPRRYTTYEQLLSDEDIEVVLNLTVPLVHFETTSQAILSGKHVYTEKPLAHTFEQSRQLLALANEHGVRLGSSPDVPLGAAVQTCRKLVDDGYIGRVVGVSANLIKRGVETWHPNPDFLYQPGAGPMLDMGPYYLSALIQVAGPVEAVAGMHGISFPTRTITSQPRYGELIHVNVPTYVNSLLRFASGAMGTFTATFDVYKASVPFIEIYGTEGTLNMPDPNVFGGDIRIYRKEHGEFTDFPLIFGYGDNSRGLGLADMCAAIKSGREHRASAELAVHVLEIIDAVKRSGDDGEHINLSTSCKRPAPMALAGVAGILDE